MRMSRWCRPVLVGVLAALSPMAAHAWEVPVHELFPQRALQADPRLAGGTLGAVTPSDLDAFRTWLDTLFRAHPDEKVRAEFARRWPTPASFDARALKTLMSLNPARRVQGIDVVEGLPGTPLQVIARGSAQPDTDERNRDRLALDAAGQPRALPDGRPIPADPIILNMGSVTGFSSQAHAHYGLADVPVSSNPDVLKGDGRRFAVSLGWPAGPVKTLGREMVQEHYDLAILAALWNTPAGKSLGYLLFGNALHYLGDLGSPVHTVQVGTDEFFGMARLLTWEQSHKTLGGYLGELRGLQEVAMELLQAHHGLSEALNRKRVAEALSGKDVPENVAAIVASLGADDGEFKKDLEMAAAQAVVKGGKKPWLPLATLVSSRLVEFTSRDGGEVYRHTAGASHARLHELGAVFDPVKDDPDAALGNLKVPEVRAHLDSLYWLQAKAFARVGSAFRLLHSRFQADSAAPDDLQRAEKAQAFAWAFLTARLSELAETEERLGSYVAAPPPPVARAVHDPVWLLGPPLALLGVVTLMVLLLRRPSPPAEDAPQT